MYFHPLKKFEYRGSAGGPSYIKSGTADVPHSGAQQVASEDTMQSAVRIIVSVFLLTSAVATGYHSSAKLRRDGVLNLYPFPRVGRASRHTWQVPVNDLYLDYEPAVKRQLYAFPRVGRSDMSVLRDPYAEQVQVPVKRTDNPGMWFGPRLGRSFKSDEDDMTVQSENVARSEPERMEPLHEERKKREAEN